MIPLKLRLHNFMSYRGDATLDLSGIHLACLAGDNGHGKSSLLDAMTYALWGETRARREDDLITLGTDEMEVELTFMLGDEPYRVLRKRSKRGKTRQSAVELQVGNGNGFRPISGVSARETQARIIALLRMSYDTFINSAFLMQGRADEFTRKPAGERKQILADILGLSQYDDYEEKAKQRIRQLDDDAQRINGEITHIQQELKQKPQHAAELARLERDAAQAEAQLQESEAVLQTLRDEKRDLEQKARQADELERRWQQTRRDTQQLERDLAQKRAALEAYEARVADESRIETGFAQWQAARARDAELNTLLVQAAKLTDERNQQEQAIRAARQTLEFEARTIQHTLETLDASIAEAQARETELTKTRQALSELTEKETQRDQWRQQREQLNLQVAELKTTNQQLRAHMDALKERLTMLESATATCPVCRQPLAPTDAARLKQDFQEEGRQAGDAWRTNNDAIAQYSHQSEQIRTHIQKLEQDLRAKDALQKYEARLSEQAQRAAEAQLERARLQAQWQTLAAQLEQRQYAIPHQARLAELQTQLATLGYDATEHDRARAQINELASFEQERAQLVATRERLAAERETLGHLVARLDSLQQLLASDETQWQALKGDSARLAPVNQQATEQQRKVNELQGRVGVLNRQLGAARQWVEHAKNMEAQLVVKQQSLKECLAERALYEELRVAFGKKGVQAMLIEAAIPEIEEEANALLRQMTDGRMSVRFETQREKVSVKKDEAATIETLDLVISDELGPRGYELYSGGEAFRVNFAVRIALSKLLARRAGARLQTLVIDEGFGTQDTQGRERLVEAINTVRDQFEKILVITHIDELKEMFPVRIDIVKTGGASSIFVS
jgi:exonuclease SbcC